MLKSDRCHKTVHNRFYLLLSEMCDVYERIRTELLSDFYAVGKNTLWNSGFFKKKKDQAASHLSLKLFAFLSFRACCYSLDWA